MPRTPNETVPTQMRLRPETLAELDAIAARLTETTGVTHSRTDAVRWAAHREAQRLKKKIRNSG